MTTETPYTAHTVDAGWVCVGCTARRAPSHERQARRAWKPRLGLLWLDVRRVVEFGEVFLQEEMFEWQLLDDVERLAIFAPGQPAA